MSDPVESLILDLLEWIRSKPRTYPELMRIWRTSCPRLPVWEEAGDRGYVDIRRIGRSTEVILSSRGLQYLLAHRSATSPRCDVPRPPPPSGQPTLDRGC